MRYVLIMFLLVCLVIPVRAADAPAPEKFTLTAVGDIGFMDELGNRILKYGPDYPWKNVLHLLKDTDLLLGNLEAPLSLSGSKWLKKTYYLHADPRTVAALNVAGFDYFGLANNHVMDFGTIALKETLEILDQNGFAHSGAGFNEEAAQTPAFLDLGSLKVAVLSYSLVGPIDYKASGKKPGSAWGYKQTILDGIKKAQPMADLVIIWIHWGADYVGNVMDWQKTLAHDCIDSGAAAIIGHHPHIVLPVEIYQGKPIIYSVGNFSFGTFNRKAKGAIFKLTYTGAGLVEEIKIYPLNVNNNEVFFQMGLLQGAAAEKVIGNLQRNSVPFGTKIRFEDDKGVIKL